MQGFRAAVRGGVRSLPAVDSSRRFAPLVQCWRCTCVCQLEQLLRPVQHINTAAARSGRGSGLQPAAGSGSCATPSTAAVFQGLHNLASM